MSEQWKAVPGFDGLYEVSDQGRVRSYASMGPGGAKRRKGEAHPVAIVVRNQYGHRAVGLQVSGKQRLFSVHRLVLEAFVGPCPTGHEGRHVDENDPGNNCLSNLRWGTKQENEQDKRRHGTATLSGGKRKRAVRGSLSLEQAREIVAASAAISHRELARRYGVSGTYVAQIRAGTRRPEAQNARA